MDDQTPLIENGAVAVRDGEIIAVGGAQEIRAEYNTLKRLSGRGKVLMPGLVNGHGHASMVLLRGLADDLSLDEWLNNYIFPVEGQFVDEDFVRIGTELACWEMIRGGTTTFLDMYFYPDTAATVVEECGLRALIAPSSIDFPSPGFTGWDDSFAASVDFAMRWKNKDPRITPVIGVHAPYTVSTAHLIQASETARSLDVPLTIHVSETQKEVNDITSLYGNPPVKYLNSLNFFSARVIAAHMVWPDSEEITLLEQRDVGVIHNPSSNLKLASGISPVPQMLAAGVKVGLGTDGAASNNDLDMWEEIHIAALLHKGHLLDPTVMPAYTVLRMATLGGAEALGLQDRIGAITVGRRADMIQVSFDAPRLIPLYDPISHLVYAANSDDVDTVIVDGNILMANSEIRTIDTDKVRKEAMDLAVEIAASVGE